MNSDLNEEDSSSEKQNNNDYHSMTYIDSNLTLATYNEHLNKTLESTRQQTDETTVADQITTQDNNTIVTVASAPPQTPSALGARKAAYKQREEMLKQEYYKSNPLRNYAPTRGQTILPHNFVFQNLKQPSLGNISVQSDTGNESQPEYTSYQFANSYKNKKKSLPKVYKDLRITRDVEEDRELHRSRMRTILNLNLTEFKKSSIDLLENSKKTYTEYCRNNLEKPINLTNVESVLKSIINTHSSKQNHNMKEKRQQDEYSEDDESSIEGECESFRALSKHYLNHHKQTKIDANFLVDAQTLSIKGNNKAGAFKHSKIINVFKFAGFISFNRTVTRNTGQLKLTRGNESPSGDLR